GIKSFLRRLAWDLVVDPVTRLYLLVQMGNVPDKITTGNIAVAVVKSK
ncbi:MAG: hypothetical protein JNM63_15735, partial [Spirochaetia bacterium]|nr:hypothetical protein [Spirochaetia bacterium]